MVDYDIPRLRALSLFGFLWTVGLAAALLVSPFWGDSASDWVLRVAISGGALAMSSLLLKAAFVLGRPVRGIEAPNVGVVRSARDERAVSRSRAA